MDGERAGPPEARLHGDLVVRDELRSVDPVRDVTARNVASIIDADVLRAKSPPPLRHGADVYTPLEAPLDVVTTAVPRLPKKHGVPPSSRRRFTTVLGCGQTTNGRLVMVLIGDAPSRTHERRYLTPRVLLGGADQRPAGYDTQLYKGRHVVERSAESLKQ